MHDEHVQKNQRVSKGVHAEPLRGPMEEDCPATAGKLDREHGGDDLSGGDDDGERDKTTMLGSKGPLILSIDFITALLGRTLLDGSADVPWLRLEENP
ncbi:hypothetical protein JRO89_XS05G0210600 [Xanthoceras sorbifolium]|uniref:Uncharacterized protein n=1 Tax=Xanthoceras sorbifolium TaxID=99658 RepID=A0ABQ8I2M1_9ROSI|nr:hypothetical protein JRO89_XS05G0210600 [Xanthoceras sorbifolium]